MLVLLALLASIVVPQFGPQEEGARLSALKADLAQVRRAIVLYYHQHNNTYPGAVRETDGAPVANAAEATSAFITQLTQFSGKDGIVSSTRTARARFGPYIKGGVLPANPLTVDDTKAREVSVDISTDDLTVVAADPGADDNTGWKFYVKTGRFIANDGQTSIEGTSTEDL